MKISQLGPYIMVTAFSLFSCSTISYRDDNNIREEKFCDTIAKFDNRIEDLIYVRSGLIVTATQLFCRSPSRDFGYGIYSIEHKAKEKEITLETQDLVLYFESKDDGLSWTFTRSEILNHTISDKDKDNKIDTNVIPTLRAQALPR